MNYRIIFKLTCKDAIAIGIKLAIAKYAYTRTKATLDTVNLWLLNKLENKLNKAAEASDGNGECNEVG